MFCLLPLEFLLVGEVALESVECMRDVTVSLSRRRGYQCQTKTGCHSAHRSQLTGLMQLTGLRFLFSCGVFLSVVG